MSPLKTLLNELVDYAGLFPPARLPLPLVVKNYQKYLGGAHRWMLGRLIIPAARLSEFREVFEQLIPDAGGDEPWKISALVPPVDATDDGFRAALNSIEEFNTTFSQAQVDTVEGKLADESQTRATVENLPESLAAFLEIPLAGAPIAIERLAAVARPQVYAKIRTGGVTPDLIPDSGQVSQFIDHCAKQDLGFKATAGLHHPIRGTYPLTYDPDATRDTMHGFLNVFVAACFARIHHWPASRLEEILKESDPEQFEMGPDGITLLGETVDQDGILKTRREFAISFGSCSFNEPVEEIQRPGWLESDPADSPS